MCNKFVTVLRILNLFLEDEGKLKKIKSSFKRMKYARE